MLSVCWAMWTVNGIVLPAVTDDISLLVHTVLVTISVPVSVVFDVDVDTSIFPTSTRGATLKRDFPFYLGLGSFFGGSVTPVRRREDTNGDGDTGVKVQLAGLSSVSPLFSLAAVESQD